MKRRAVFLSTLLAIALTGTGAWLLLFRFGSRASGPLQQEAYVWQRAWSEAVRNAVGQYGMHFSALTVLNAEVSWKNGKPQVTRVAVDYPSLAETQKPVGVALRIGPYSGLFTPEEEPTKYSKSITTFLINLAASLVAEAQSNHVNLSELQIDFDCAESKLDGYRVWVEAIQRRVTPLPVTITALPSWLDSRAFKRLAAVATNYVLQVHSLERPKSIHTPFTLCNPRAAQRWVERAGRIGAPFRVALPTYGYTLAFDPTGKFIGLSAEGPRPNWPTNTLLREVHADSTELAKLVERWNASRPAAMRGIIWYRLPVATDKFNWSWDTMRGILEAASLPNGER